MLYYKYKISQRRTLSTNKFARLVGFDKNRTTVKTEITSGIVTFLAMAYILTLNPLLMLNLFDSSQYEYLYSSLFVATALGGFLGTMLMALYAKLPLAQAPGLGLNSMVGGLLGGSLIGFSLSFGNAMLLVFLSGVLFLLLSIFKIHGLSIREIMYRAIPESIRKAISVGIGLGILSYTIISICSYLVNLIAYACSKSEDKVKPVWDLHIVMLIIAALFIVYFFMPITF